MNKPKNEIGNKYGRLTVIRRATEEECPRKAGKSAIWLCKCDCGNYTFAPGNKLRKGERVSCGCLSKEKATVLAKELGIKNRTNLIGKRFGKLVAIKYLGSKHTSKTAYAPMWLCKCDCGNMAIVQASNLMSGHTTSCGCNKNMKGNKPSSGEDKIIKILQNENILFTREKTFKGLNSRYGINLRFDFAIYDKKGNILCLIEFNGLQHYERVEYF